MISFICHLELFVFYCGIDTQTRVVHLVQGGSKTSFGDCLLPIAYCGIDTQTRAVQGVIKDKFWGLSLHCAFHDNRAERHLIILFDN